ncbi:MAG: DUF72 domain-containing protein [bacterium]|nr:DUF72 domain-containing protein [bacterium]
MTEPQSAFAWHEEQASPPGRMRPALAIKLAGRLGGLAARGIRLGTSSWKYPGWVGQVYDPAGYQTRKRFSKPRFERECLAEYATVFPTVCGDFAFYRFPTAATWDRIFGQVPSGFQFSLKVPEDITALRFSDLARYGARAGTENPDFMNAELLEDKLLSRLEPHRSRVGVLIFQFGTIHQGPLSKVDGFAARLDELLARLPRERFTFAVEVRNASFLDGDSPYLAVLREHGVAHCFNSWSRMPSVAEQMHNPRTVTADTMVARFLLQPGRGYQQAVEAFSPYERVVDPYPEGRHALRSLIDRCLAEQRKLYAFVNNRVEGNAPQTIDEVTEQGLID